MHLKSNKFPLGTYSKFDLYSSTLLMSTSTTTRKKKKLVYKQDSDGVFRLKKVDDNGNGNRSIDSNEYLLRKAKVDNYLNELMDCSYTIDGDSDSVGRQRSKTVSNEINSQLGNKSNDCKQTEKVPKPHTSKVRSNSLPTYSSSLLSTDSSIGSLTNPPRSPSIHRMVQLKQTQKDFKSFHVPSFLIGVILTAIAAAFKEQLTRLTVGLVVCGIALVLLVVCGIAGALYLGFIKQEDIKIFNLLSTYLQELQQSSEIISNGYNKRDDVSDIIQHYTGNDGRRKSRESLTSSLSHSEQQSVTTKRRMSNIKATPYRFDRPAEPFNSSVENIKSNRQLKQNYTMGNNSTPNFATDSQDPLHNIPALNRINTEPTQSSKNRCKLTSPPYPVNKSQRPRFDSVQTANSTKNLPSLPSEELPFINEVKLIDSMEQRALYDQDSGNDYVSSLLVDNHFSKRGSSPTRQQSILGTTANYEKFVANVDH